MYLDLGKEKDINVALKALIDHDPEKGKVTFAGDGNPNITAHDVYHLALPYLQDNAKEILERQTYTFLHERNKPKKDFGLSIASYELGRVLAKWELIDWDTFALLPLPVDRKCDLVNFIGFKLKLKDINVGLVRLAALVNVIVDDNFATATLAKPTMIPVNVPETNEHEIFLVVYLAIDQDLQEDFNKKYGEFTFQEGETPRSLK